MSSDPNESPQPESVSPSSSRTDRITRWLLIAIGVYTGLLVTLLNVFLLGSGKTIDRAIILMADGLILFWIIIGGSLTPVLPSICGQGESAPQRPEHGSQGSDPNKVR